MTFTTTQCFIAAQPEWMDPLINFCRRRVHDHFDDYEFVYRLYDMTARYCLTHYFHRRCQYSAQQDLRNARTIVGYDVLDEETLAQWVALWDEYYDYIGPCLEALDSRGDCIRLRCYVEEDRLRGFVATLEEHPCLNVSTSIVRPRKIRHRPAVLT